MVRSFLKPMALLCAATLALGMLTGCAPGLWLYRGGVSQLPSQGSGGAALPDTPQSDPSGTEPPQSGSSAEKTGAYGSVGLLAFPSVLVSVYLDEKDGAHAWDEDGIAQSRQNLAQAVAWIGQQCETYHAAPDIRYDDGTADDLFYHMDYDGTFAKEQNPDDDDGFSDAIVSFCEQIDTDAFEQKYGTSSIGFLIFIPRDGTSATMVHDLSMDDPYYEYSCLYRWDSYDGTQTTAALYAHEILHLYGAPDLYEGSVDPFVTPELTEYVSEQWPNAIMLTIDTLNPQTIPQQICPLTAYRLGLCNTFAGIEQFPDVALVPPGIFDSAATAESAQTPWDNAENGLAV
jgi:hypothetical protein